MTDQAAVDLQLEAEELLESGTAGEASGLGAAPVEDDLAAELLAVVEDHAVRLDARSAPAEKEAGARPPRHGLAEHRRESLRRHRRVGRGHIVHARGEAELVPGPAMHDERLDEAARSRRQVARVEAPGVLAAQVRSPLDDREANVRSCVEERERDEPVGQAAADEDVLVVDGAPVSAHRDLIAVARRDRRIAERATSAMLDDLVVLSSLER